MSRGHRAVSPNKPGLVKIKLKMRHFCIEERIKIVFLFGKMREICSILSTLKKIPEIHFPYKDAVVYAYISLDVHSQSPAPLTSRHQDHSAKKAVEGRKGRSPGKRRQGYEEHSPHQQRGEEVRLRLFHWTNHTLKF